MGGGGEGEIAAGVHGGSGGEQGAGVGVLGVVEDAVGGAVFDDPAVLHDGDAVSGLIAGLGDDGEVVRDEERGEVVLRTEVAEEGEDLGLDGDVEGGGGLVGDEELGAVDEGHGDDEPLALAAGELVGVVAEAGFGGGKGDFVEGGEDAGADLGAGQVRGVDLEGFGDLAADAKDRVKGGHGLLEDHGDAASAVLAHGGFGEV